MSLFSALNTSVSGLSAQSSAFGNISDNVANSQSVGYKSVDTTFEDYLTTSNAIENDPGAVVAQPDYTNTVQGTISQSSNPLAMAISGQGFFAVSVPNGTVTGSTAPTFGAQSSYTRDGDFTLDKNGYLVNDGGQYLQGWTVNSQTGVANQSSLAPIQITQTQFNPQATKNVSLSANLPNAPSTTASYNSQVDVYDALGQQHALNLTWSPVTTGSPAAVVPNSWNLAIASPDDSGGAPIATAVVDFGDGTTAPAGTIASITPSAGTVPAGTASGDPATLSFNADFGAGTQPLTVSLGNFGQATGVTQFSATDYSLRNESQDGVPPGSFTNLTVTSTGSVVANYNNGQSQTVAQVPIITFQNPDALQRQNGQAFTATQNSGAAIAQQQNTNGAGTLVTSSVEGSNVDIAGEFSKLIVAQEAYGANAKLITTADSMLQVTINMKT